MLGHQDLYNSIKVARAISPQNPGSGDTAIVSATIDRDGFDGLTFAIATGSLSDANATFAVLVEDDDDSAMGTAAAVSDSLLLGTEAAAGFQYDDDNECRKIGYIGNKRYVRLTITPTGNTGDVYVSAVALLHGARVTPVS